MESGRLDIPPGGDVGTFLLSDGKLNERPKSLKRLSLEELFTAYLDSLPIGALEPETLRVAGIHLGHFRRILGSSKKADSITTSRLQLYINKRSRQPGKHGRRVSAATIKKELATLRAIWNWARTEGYLKADFPSGLHLTKEDAKTPRCADLHIDAPYRRAVLNSCCTSSCRGSVFQHVFRYIHRL